MNQPTVQMQLPLNTEISHWGYHMGREARRLFFVDITRIRARGVGLPQYPGAGDWYQMRETFGEVYDQDLKAAFVRGFQRGVGSAGSCACPQCRVPEGCGEREHIRFVNLIREV